MTGVPLQAAESADRFAAAHRALRADTSIQFTLPPAPAPQPPPAWLKAFGEWMSGIARAIGRFFRWIGQFFPDLPYARILLWGVLIALGAALAWMIVERVRHGAWRLPKLRRSRLAGIDPDPEPEWQPDAAPVREWLREADILAAAGRYAEAVHHLLFRSVEDIQRRRPQAVRPALTSRELASVTAIPYDVRQLFAAIARQVERSLFGGRPLSVDDWREARAAYADLALPKAWRG